MLYEGETGGEAPAPALCEGKAGGEALAPMQGAQNEAMLHGSFDMEGMGSGNLNWNPLQTQTRAKPFGLVCLQHPFGLVWFVYSTRLVWFGLFTAP